jgi:aminotransferase
MTRLHAIYGGVNLAQGFPDFDPPPEIIEAAERALRDGYNQYAITWGAPRLREALARKVTEFNRIPTDPQANVTVTCGATEAMIATLMAILNPGDAVVMFAPFYENYGPDAVLSGAEPQTVFLRPEAPGGAWGFDVAELEAAVTPRTRAIIVNTPHNPTGHVFTRSELEAIAGVCCRHDLIAVTDEIYEHILYDGREHVSLGSLPEMGERTVTISGFSKTFAVTGWRLGYAVAPAEISIGIRRVHDFLTVGAPHPLQEAAAAALSLPPSYYEEMTAAYTRRRDRMQGIAQAAGFGIWPPEGAYYLMTDITSFGFPDDVTFARHLIENVGVAVVPGSSFYPTGALDGRQIVRFAFPKQEPTFAEAEQRLASLKK